MQYSLLLLIYVQVQCDLAITRFTCVDVYSLNCLDLFLKYKIGSTYLVCVRVFGIYVLKILLRNIFESLKYCLDPWLSCMLDCIHICVFPLLKNCFKATSTDPRHLSIPGLSVELFSCFLSQSRHLLIARSIDRATFCPLDRCSIAGQSIKVGFCSIVSRHLSIHWDFFLHALFFTCFASFCYLVVHSILFHYIHAFLWFPCAPLIIFMFLRWSFLTSCTLCQSWQKGGEYVLFFLDSTC